MSPLVVLICAIVTFIIYRMDSMRQSVSRVLNFKIDVFTDLHVELPPHLRRDDYPSALATFALIIGRISDN